MSDKFRIVPIVTNMEGQILGFPPMPRAVHRDDLHYWQRIEGLALPASAYLGEKL